MSWFYHFWDSLINIYSLLLSLFGHLFHKHSHTSPVNTDFKLFFLIFFVISVLGFRLHIFVFAFWSSRVPSFDHRINIFKEHKSWSSHLFLPHLRTQLHSFLWNNQQMQLYAVNFIPLLGSLYMFRVFYTLIIRSTIYNCIYSHWYKP